LIKDVSIQGAILEKDGKFQVNAYPAFIPNTEKANVEIEAYSGKEYSDDVKQEIKSVMESFFKIYCTYGLAISSFWG
jgi:hypothetical protein